MARFRITNSITGQELGVYEADTEAKALDEMARAGRFDDFAHLCREVPMAPGATIVKELEPAGGESRRNRRSLA